MENKNIRPNWDAFTGLFSIAFGLIYGGYAYVMPRPMFGNPMDPVYFPLGVAAVALIVGICLLIKSDFKASLTALSNLLNEDDAKKGDRKKILYTCLISIGYAVLFDPLGYVISTFLFMTAMLTITSGFKAWKTSITVGLIFSVSVYFIFAELLAVSLPALPFMR